MAKAKKVKKVVDYFNLPDITIIDAKKETVTSNVSAYGLVEGQQYECLRKCKTREDVVIFEIVLDGQKVTKGACWFD